MKPGLYKLTRDVPNDTRDKRVNFARDWRHMPTWKAGTLFHVRQYEEECPRIYMLLARYGYTNDMVIFPDDSPRWQNTPTLRALLAALEPAEATTVVEVLKANNLDGWEAQGLQWLVTTGRLTLDDVREACAHAYDAFEETE